MFRASNLRLWALWVAANGVGELAGLGATLAIDFLIVWRVTTERTTAATVLGILLMTASGAIEGTLVGWLQWAVLRGRLPSIARRRWVLATVLGATVAWFFGSLPSTLMDMSAQAGGQTIQEPRLATVLLLAAAMGLALGFVLAYPQWRVLRAATAGAWLWLPANSLAWALGMPLVFVAIDLAQPRPLWPALAIAAAGLLLTGVVVGMVHGLALLRLTRTTIPVDRLSMASL